MTLRTPALALLLALPASLGLAESSSVGSIRIEAGQKFLGVECRRCHAIDSQDKSQGPPLEGIIGRKAGSVEN